MTESIFLFELIALIFSVVIHEVSHGYMAEYLGDPTARLAGRLTLNPVRHLDFFGSILLPSLLAITGQPILGWAKPVPYNPYNLKDPRQGGGLIALAGPASNILVALISGLGIRLLSSSTTGSPQQEILVQMLLAVVTLNLTLAFFNLLPIPPIDGSKVVALVLPIRWQLYLDAFWARVWRVFQENFLVSMILLFLFLPYLLDGIFYFLHPLIRGLTVLFTGLSV